MRLFFNILILGAPLLLFVTGSRAEYDDPAVAVCEWVIRNLELPAGITYQRSSATIDGAAVTIEYLQSALNIKPSKQSKTCEFKRVKDHFIFFDKGISDFVGCDTEIVTLNSFLGPDGKIKSQFDLEPMKRALENLDTCKARLGSALKAGVELLIKRDAPLVRLGIYPIKAGDTKLVAPKP